MTETSPAFPSRARFRRTLRSSLALALLTASLGCSEKKPPKEPEVPPPSLTGAKRPPFPNMATATWGTRVIEERAAKADPELVGRGYKAALEAALHELHSLEDGSEARAVSAAVAAWRAAQADPERATAAALAAAALTLDPSPEGYKERLTDAHGLAAYAGTLEPGTVLSQAARAFVAIAAGRVYEGQKLVSVLSGGPGLDVDAQLFLGLSRFYLAERSDAALAPWFAVLKDKPESGRARAVLAEMFLDLGMSGRVLEVLALPGAPKSPFLDALKGRALVLEGQHDEGVKLLKEAEGKLAEARRGQALYWLGRSLTRGDTLDEATAVLATLSSRPGYEHEVALLDALLAQLRGDFARAKQRAQSVCRTRGAPLHLALECQWATVDACAGLGDQACVENWARRALGADGDKARLEQARAALALVGKAEGVDAEVALRRAHLLSPFDEQLGARVQVEAVPGGARVAAAVRAARRAQLFDAKDAASEALKPVVEKNRACRVCRALFALSARDVDEGARRAVRALDGAGPPLDEDDLVALIDLLGGSPIDEGKRVLAELAKDARPAVKAAVARARADLKDPEGRKRRKEDAHGHGDEPAAPGTVPVPSLAPPVTGEAR